MARDPKLLIFMLASGSKDNLSQKCLVCCVADVGSELRDRSFLYENRGLSRCRLNPQRKYGGEIDG